MCSDDKNSKVLAHLENTEMKLIDSSSEGAATGSEYYQKITALQKQFDFDTLISVSQMSINNLTNFAKRNDIKELHHFILPGDCIHEDKISPSDKATNFTSKEVKKVSLEILGQLEFTEDSIEKTPVNRMDLGKEFEAVIKSGKIYNLKASMGSITQAKLVLGIFIGMFTFVVLFSINNYLLKISLQNQLILKISTPNYNDYKNIFIKKTE